MKIPQIVHACWFGENEYPPLVKKCIQSWQKKLPGYQITIWTENNFDVYQNSFLRKHYKKKNWAFVSDMARLMILHEHGGIYLDTDVEVLKSFNPLLKHQLFIGFQEKDRLNTAVIGSVKQHKFLNICKNTLIARQKKSVLAGPRFNLSCIPTNRLGR